MAEVNYLWDPIEDNVIAELDEGGDAIAEYTTEPELYGNVVSQRRDGGTNCFYSDGLGSTTEVTNAAGDAIATCAYSAFGEITESNGNADFSFHFIGRQGYYRDSETDTYYIRRRSYRPTICRWLSVDPGLTFSNDPFAYCDNRPIFSIDASGLEGERPPDDASCLTCKQKAALADMLASCPEGAAVLRSLYATVRRVLKGPIKCEAWKDFRSNVTTGTMYIDAGADRCKLMDGIVFELSNLSQKRDQDCVDALAKKGSLTLRDYMTLVGQVEFVSLHITQNISLFCGEAWHCPPAFPKDYVTDDFTKWMGRNSNLNDYRFIYVNAREYYKPYKVAHPGGVWEDWIEATPFTPSAVRLETECH